MSNTAFLFPGQGAQAVGMGKQIADEFPIANQLFDQANEILGYDLKKLCFEGPAEELNATANSQPGLFVASIAALEKLKAESPEIVESCEFTAGLSLGEYTALYFAGSIDFESGLKLVAERGKAMQAAADLVDSGMTSILGLEQQEVAEICDQCRQTEVLQIANLLCPGNIAISGHTTALERAGIAATAAGAMRAIPLTVAGAFHTSLMEPASERLRQAITNVEFVAPSKKLYSNVDAEIHSDTSEIRELLATQLVSPVRWEDSMRAMIDAGVDTFYEVGPGKVLRGLLKRINRKLPAHGTMV